MLKCVNKCTPGQNDSVFYNFCHWKEMGVFKMPKKRMAKPAPRFILPSSFPEPFENAFDCPRNTFLSAKLFLFMLICLRYPISHDQQELGKLQKYFAMDAEFCPECFLPKSDMCNYFTSNFEFVFDDLVQVINSFISTKRVHYGKLRGRTEKIVAKHSGRNNIFEHIQTESYKLRYIKDMDERLWNLFVRSDRTGFHFCRQTNLDLFVDYLTKYTNSRIETWMHLLVNVETILMAPLNRHKNIATPTYYGHCGFTVYEQYDGLTLAQYEAKKISYLKKLKIALKLLLAVSGLTDGFDDYRIYLTDLTLDNVVYDDRTEKVSFIDLDSVIIVDGFHNRTGRMEKPAPPEWRNVHKYEKIVCEGCFAYQKNEICKYHQSDINIFAVCQLLNEDLYGNPTQGYLKPIPAYIDDNFPLLAEKLGECVECPPGKCLNRFPVSVHLAQIIAMIIKSLQ